MATSVPASSTSRCQTRRTDPAHGIRAHALLERGVDELGCGPPRRAHVDDDDVGLHRAASTDAGAASRARLGEARGPGRGRRRAARRGGRARTALPRRGCRPGACRRRSACARCAPRPSARREPTSTEPTGAPRPLRQADADGVELPAVVAQRRRPWRRGRSRAARRRGASRRPRSGWRRAASRICVERLHRAAAEVVGVLDDDERGARPGRGRRPVIISDSGAGGVEQAALARPRTRLVMPESTAAAPELGPQHVREAVGDELLARPRRAAARRAGWPSSPVGVNSPASWPSRSATRSSSARTVGSSPKTSSPTSARAIAWRIASVGRVRVSRAGTGRRAPASVLVPASRRRGRPAPGSAGGSGAGRRPSRSACRGRRRGSSPSRRGTR